MFLLPTHGKTLADFHFNIGAIKKNKKEKPPSLVDLTKKNESFLLL